MRFLLTRLVWCVLVEASRVFYAWNGTAMSIRSHAESPKLFSKFTFSGLNWIIQFLSQYICDYFITVYL